jgi:hypothetical protein
MEISLNDQDIERALTQYVGANVMPAKGVSLDIKLFATRNPTGFKATVTFIEAGSLAAGPVANPVVPEQDNTIAEPEETTQKRTRRTRAQIEADEAAALAGTSEPSKDKVEDLFGEEADTVPGDSGLFEGVETDTEPEIQVPNVTDMDIDSTDDNLGGLFDE